MEKGPIFLWLGMSLLAGISHVMGWGNVLLIQAIVTAVCLVSMIRLRIPHRRYVTLTWGLRRRRRKVPAVPSRPPAVAAETDIPQPAATAGDARFGGAGPDGLPGLLLATMRRLEARQSQARL